MIIRIKVFFLYYYSFWIIYNYILFSIYKNNYCKLANSTKVVGYPTGTGVVLYAEECINSFNQSRLKELNTLKSDIEEFEKEQ